MYKVYTIVLFHIEHFPFYLYLYSQQLMTIERKIKIKKYDGDKYFFLLTFFFRHFEIWKEKIFITIQSDAQHLEE